MKITIKPYSTEYAEQCADLEKYLWREDKDGREKRFRWEYTDCPNSEHPLSVIAVNEENEVLGFRGYFVNRFSVNGSVIKVAQLADTVVSDKARRMGIFQKMTDFSLDFLLGKGVSLILNLSPSWPPYYGYKKLGFEDLSCFHSKYRFSIVDLFIQKINKKGRMCWNGKNDYVLKKEESYFCVCQKITDEILKEIESLKKASKISSCLNFDNIKWRTERPGKGYVYAYAINQEGKLKVFAMLSTSDYYIYHLGLLLYDDLKAMNFLWRMFVREYKPAIVAAWDFAIGDDERMFLSKSGFLSIPFINRIRRNPPVLLRTLQKNVDGSLNWVINGIDIRKVENWSLSKLDHDSF